MKLRFTPAALRQLEDVLEQVAQFSPQGAARIQTRLVQMTALLTQYPRIGRATSRRAVRRIAIVPYPYLLDFRVGRNEVVILGFRHAARRPRL